MTTSQISLLSKPVGNEQVAGSAFAYMRTRTKHQVYDLIIKSFKQSGLSQADLARRLGKDTAYLSRLMNGPGNLTLETVSDLLFAIGGGGLSASIEDPLKKNKESKNTSAGTTSLPIAGSSKTRQAVGVHES